MKTFITSLILVFAQQSLALTSDLKTGELDPNRFPGAVESAQVTINQQENRATLTVHYKTLCPDREGISCRALNIPDVVISLPITKKWQGDCGATLYKAQTPSRMLNVPMDTMVVTDNSSLVCRILIPKEQMTEVQIGLEMNGQELQDVSTFAGLPLISNQ